MGIIREGKTKIIWTGPKPHEVEIESKDDITAGDGEKKDRIIGKASMATETTCNCFELLDKYGIRNHFKRRGNNRTFIARELRMIPIEIVSRRVATGSYLKRHPETKEGIFFAPLVVELFFKDDKLHDPIMIWKEARQRFEMYKPHEPITSSSYIRDLSLDEILTPDQQPLSWESKEDLCSFGVKAFHVLESAWRRLGYTLVDLKIECGWDYRGEMMIGDVIDNDSWRLREGQKNGRALDKQVYRDLKKRDQDSLEAVRHNYAVVAELTKKFVSC